MSGPAAFPRLTLEAVKALNQILHDNRRFAQSDWDLFPGVGDCERGKNNLWCSDACSGELNKHKHKSAECNHQDPQAHAQTHTQTLCG
jgi:hypothetical protein